METKIKWTRYDGTPETMPHVFKESLSVPIPLEQKIIAEKEYMVIPCGQTKALPVPLAWSWDCFGLFFEDSPQWIWESNYVLLGNEYENYNRVPEIGDMWALWPEAPKGE